MESCHEHSEQLSWPKIGAGHTRQSVMLGTSPMPPGTSKNKSV